MIRILHKLHDRLCWRFCGRRIWNRDMSIENDAMRVQIELQQARIRKLEDDQR